jgi:hypothetical protein
MRYMIFAVAIAAGGCGGNSLNNSGGDMATADLSMSGGGGDMTVTPDGGPGMMCDLAAQNCPSGMKCEITGGMMGGARCVAQNGSVGADQPCVRMMGGGGDDCAAGLQCTTRGSTQMMPLCRKLCTKDSDCAGGQQCALVSQAVTTAGVCIPSCEPGTGSCTNGLACGTLTLAVGSTMTNQILFFTCRAAGTSPLYGACNRSADCVAESICDSTAGWCAPLCDDTHACVQPPSDGGVSDAGTIMTTCMTLGNSAPNNPGVCQ